VYLAGTTTPATVYGSNTASTGINTAPQVTSSANGAVAFWLDSNDYTSEQLFDISISSGSLNASLSNVQIIVWDAVNATNAQNATKLSTARNISASGDATGTVSFDGSANITIPLTLANTGVTNGVYGSNTQIPQITVDSKGRVTSATALSLFTAQNTAVFTSSGTWNVPQGVTTISVSGCAGGGGGGGSVYSNSTNYYGGLGGGAGQSVIKKLISVTPGHTLSITIGAGGAGGAAGTNYGSSGGNTTIVDSTTSTTLLTLSGGSHIYSLGTWYNSVGYGGYGGPGESGSFGIGGDAVSSDIGHTGIGYGAGGSGASATSSAQYAGGSGTSGIIIIEW
jgi:hypothetical protein